LDIIESNTKWLKLEQRIKWFVDIIEAYTKKVLTGTVHQTVCGYYSGENFQYFNGT
jgi:hypothetical protein